MKYIPILFQLIRVILNRNNSPYKTEIYALYIIPIKSKYINYLFTYLLP